MTWLWVLMAFLSGAIPFSVLVGRFGLHTDIRRYGDHNPGATNVLRAGGKAWGGLALMLDMMKGALPVALAWFVGGVSGWPLALVALAPIAGHAFSPFLGFNGGKAIAVTGGVWIGLTVGEAGLVLLLLIVLWYLIVDVDAWAVMLTLLSFPVYIFAADKGMVWLAVWLGTLAILAWKHRADLTTWPQPRLWLRNVVHR